MKMKTQQPQIHGLKIYKTWNHKILEENRQYALWHGSQHFFGYVSSGKGTKAKMNKWDFIKLKSLRIVKKTMCKV